MIFTYKLASPRTEKNLDQENSFQLGIFIFWPRENYLFGGEYNFKTG